MHALERPRPPEFARVASLLAVAAVAGLAAGIRPEGGPVVALAVAFVLVTLNDLAIGVIVFTTISFLGVITSAGGVVDSFGKAMGGLLFCAWYGDRLVGRRDAPVAARRRLAPALTISLVSLALWSALSVIWADNAHVAATSTMSFVLDILLVPIVVAAVRRREQLILVVAAFVAGAVLSTVYGFVHPAAAGTGDYGRLTGGLADANNQAAVLVAAVPLAVALACTSRRGWPRVLGWLAALTCVAGIFDTLSRGGLLALGVVLVAAVLFGGRWRARALLLLAIVAIGTVTYFAAFAPSSARDRVTMSSTSGRSDLWRVGWRIVESHPWTGVGAGNFQGAAVYYVQRVSVVTRADLIVDTPHVAHNVYLELLADLGIPGLAAFLGVAGFSLLAAGRAARVFAWDGDRQLEALSRGLVLAVIGFLAADVFLSGQFSKQLWLTLALCSAAGVLSRDRGASPRAFGSASAS